MEDSYTVHRRRKAAARRRQKTPEPSSRSSSIDLLTEEEAGDVDMEKDEEEEQRRLKMERMVEDTERMEERAEVVVPQPAKVRAMSPAVRRSEQKSEFEVKEKLPRRSASPLRAPEPGNSNNGSNKRPNDRENVELRRRMGSPDTARISSARHLSPTSASSDPYDDDLSDSRSGGVRRRASSRHRYSDEDETDEQPRAVQHRRSPMKKQIIPISDNRLMEDVARAKRAYSHRERSYEYEYEDDDEDYAPRRGRQREAGASSSALRRRKPSVLHTDQEKEDIGKSLTTPKSSWWSWIPFFGSRKQKVQDLIEEDKKKIKEEKLPAPPVEKSKQIEQVISNEPEKVTIRDFFRSLIFVTAEFRAFCQQNPREVAILVELRNLCIVETIITLILCGLGGFAFRFTEGAFESFYKCGVKRVKRDFLDSLWNFSHNMKEDDWKSLARSKLKAFEEQLHAANEAGVSSYSGMKNWSFLNSVVYSLTVVTTIGYGHISPSTSTGRALTIVYAIFGIPMFLIVLADFGKLFTRGIKFLWAFVRRLYYTGSCRKVRRTVHMQEMMKGVQLVYDWSTSFRRPSQMTDEEIVEMERHRQQQQQQQQQQHPHHTSLSVDGNTPQQTPESPSTPDMSAFEIDDEFNLPISVAITILVLYIIIGAVIFNIFEDWTFFESFYFVFISMSTIGFGDFVPQDPLYMMLSIVYLIFGLALTSMCINVVQVKLADQFKQASQKIGLAIGVHVAEEEGALKPVPPERVEIAEVHGAAPKERVAPKAKPEEADL
ncbi:uncharacterized protein LOC106649680 isoform X2 [Trichogramma pretiosum]|uniref:uncharacterized protein LOC106649680 isoform X2 n=1 Tax=Trichogramma pretiosum TaxID=7493 RepID=UPI0006C9C536|nr:uncharacterized protein LOC106649680 isoform X2 [Trichogramma pretiosum]